MKFLKDIWHGIKKHWFVLILLVVGIILLFKYGVFEIFIIGTYMNILVLYIMLKNSMANMMIRHLFNMRIIEDEQKLKRKNKSYEKAARKTAKVVKKPSFK